MKISFINDWQYLFSKDMPSTGFSFFMLCYLCTGLEDLPIDGVTLVIMGLGFRVHK